MNNQSSFDKIDEYFSSEEDKNKMYLMYLFLALAIGYAIYTSIMPMAEKYFKSSKSANTTLTNNLNKEKSFVATNTKASIDKKRTDIVNLKAKHTRIKETNIYVDKKIRELSYLLFDDKNWANFLDSITTTAKEFDIKVEAIRNNINELSSQKIQQILSVEVKLRGSYHGMVKFINSLEESTLIVDIHNIKLEGKENVEGLVNIAVWGMKY